MNESLQVTHLLTAWALANKSLDMFVHVLPALALACQLPEVSVDLMMSDDLVMRSDDRVVFLFRESGFFVKIMVFFLQW
jgi:hypothetical protein